MRKSGEATAILDDLGIDALCERIKADESQISICRALEISRGTLNSWLAADPTRQARAKAARIASAIACDELSLAALEAIPDNGTTAQVARQKEIASHYRWRCKTRDPRSFGEKHDMTANISTTAWDFDTMKDKTSEELAAMHLSLIGKRGK